MHLCYSVNSTPAFQVSLIRIQEIHAQDRTLSHSVLKTALSCFHDHIIVSQIFADCNLRLWNHYFTEENFLFYRCNLLSLSEPNSGVPKIFAATVAECCDLLILYLHVLISIHTLAIYTSPFLVVVEVACLWRVRAQVM